VSRDFRPRPGHVLMVAVDTAADLPSGWVRSSFSPGLARVVATREILDSGVEILGYTEKDAGLPVLPGGRLQGDSVATA
jgi:hypothetical protein